MIFYIILLFILFHDNHKLLTNAITCDFQGNTCTFSGIRTNIINQNFNPATPDPDDNTKVTKVNFTNSKMSILTDELCRAFPNLQILDVSSLSIESIMTQALDECKNLFDFIIFNNSLQEIDENLFKNNEKLDFVSFQMNQLTKINAKVFLPTKNLRQLVLGANNLKEFPVTDFPVMNTLLSLWLYVNDLSSLDAKGVVEKFPRLKEIAVHDNNFDSDQMYNIKDVFLGHGTNIVSFKPNFWTSDIIPRNRKSSNGIDTIYLVTFIILLVSFLISIAVNCFLVFKRKQEQVTPETNNPVNNDDYDFDDFRDSHIYDKLDFETPPQIKPKPKIMVRQIIKE